MLMISEANNEFIGTERDEDTDNIVRVFSDDMLQLRIRSAD